MASNGDDLVDTDDESIDEIGNRVRCRRYRDKKEGKGKRVKLTEEESKKHWAEAVKRCMENKRKKRESMSGEETEGAGKRKKRVKLTDEEKKKRRAEAGRRYREKRREERKAMSHEEYIDYKLERRAAKKLRYARNSPLYKCGWLSAAETVECVPVHYMGRMTVQCEYGCGAVFFDSESLQGKCCHRSGHGSFEDLAPLPGFLLQKLKDKKFREMLGL